MSFDCYFGTKINSPKIHTPINNWKYINWSMSALFSSSAAFTLPVDNGVNLTTHVGRVTQKHFGIIVVS